MADSDRMPLDGQTDKRHAQTIAEGVRMALRQIAEERDSVTLRTLLRAIWQIWGDATSRWIGGKLIAAITGALLALGLWLATGGWKH